MVTKLMMFQQTFRPLLLLLGILTLAACGTPAPEAADVDVDPELLLGEVIATPEQQAQAIATAVPTETPAPIDETAVPTAEPPTEMPPPTPTPQIHTVVSGENLTIISQYYGVTLSDLMNANGITDQAEVIYVGREVIIPSGEVQLEPSATAADIELVEEVAVTETAETPQTAAATPTITDFVPGAETATAIVTTTADVSSAENGTTPEATPVPRRQTLHNDVACPVEITGVPADALPVGRSAVCGLPIISYKLGSGPIPLILVGGIHGGYEWNTITLAHAMLDYLQKIPGTIPPELTVYVVPNANPDGLYAVSKVAIGSVSSADMDEDTTAGRFNGREVDLNRNWDCEWRQDTVWRDTPTSGGEFAFSEPENEALRDYILDIKPAAVLFWHSAATGVYASGCGSTDDTSLQLAQTFGAASGYPVYDSFEYYDITGDAGDYLATKQGIPSISVELTDHTNMNWDMNLDGLTALMNHLAKGADAGE